MSDSIWIIAGEASGDDYGAGLARQLQNQAPELTIRGMGGPLMRQAGVQLLVDSSELGVVGLAEVLKQLFTFCRLLHSLVRQAAAEKPRAVVLIDYPGFNIRLARRLHRLGIPILYYVSPQVWAWKKGRIRILERCVDRLLCIFPFEPQVYAGSTLDVRFLGHPLLPRLRPLTSQPRPTEEQLFLLLPGSRSKELRALLPNFLHAAAILKRKHPQLQFALPLPRPAMRQLAEELLAQYPQETALVQPQLSVGETRQYLRRACAALAASGTVTVEAAILELPLVVAYRLHPLTWWLAKRIVKLPWCTIANLVLGRELYRELLQDAGTPENLAAAAEVLLPGGSRRAEVLQGLQEFREKLGGDAEVDVLVAQQVLELAATNQEQTP